MLRNCLFGLMSSLIIVSASASLDRKDLADTAVWSAWGGNMEIKLRGDYLPKSGLVIRHRGDVISSAKIFSYDLENLGSINFAAPAGNFETFLDGRVSVKTDIVLSHDGNRVSLERLFLVGGEQDGMAIMRVMDGAGRHLLTISHIHVMADHETGSLSLHNADVLATAQLASALELPVLSDLPIGQAWIDLNLRIPEGANTSGIGEPSRGGLSCSGRPFWPQDGHEVDVGLIEIGTISDGGDDPDTDKVKVTPSARLKNFSEGDVPWVEKFTTLGSYTYEPRDQHPFLVWNMYRIHDGRIEQLGESGVKHAFLTINSNCDINCGSSHVLWPGCEDVYGVGNNNTNSALGPRSEIDASEGLFFSTCSFFDPGCNETQTNSSSNFENRLLVAPSDMEVAGADYFFDAWYVIQHDTDIWNSMGYHPISPSESSGGFWSFNPGAFSVGTPVENWVPENTIDPMEAHEVVVVSSETPGEPYPGNMPQGHLRLLVKVTEIEPDRYRYNYALMNYDFDRGVTGLSIPKDSGATVFGTYFGDIDDDAGNDWSVTDNGTSMDFTAGSEDDKQTWFTLYNYEIETSAEPVNAPVTLNFASGASPASMTVKVPTPGEFVLPEEFFEDGFESGK